MSNVYCLFCWRELRPNDPDGCACRDLDVDNLDVPDDTEGADDDEADARADGELDVLRARGYERDQQLNDQARWD